MLSKATKLRILFNQVRRATSWKSEKPRFVIFSREHVQPTVQPWRPNSPAYASFGDFMKRGYKQGQFYAVPVKPRDVAKERESVPETLLGALMESCTNIDPFKSHGPNSRMQMFSDPHCGLPHNSQQLNLQSFDRMKKQLRSQSFDRLHKPVVFGDIPAPSFIKEDLTPRLAPDSELLIQPLTTDGDKDAH